VWLERVFVWAGGAPAGGLESKSSTFSERRACVVVCVVVVPSLPESGGVQSASRMVVFAVVKIVGTRARK